jgi:hypothetical protein
MAKSRPGPSEELDLMGLRSPLPTSAQLMHPIKGFPVASGLY